MDHKPNTCTRNAKKTISGTTERLPNRALETACSAALRQQRGGGIERVWDLLQRSRGLVIDVNLDGCEWVVLSACETGLGVHAGGEGVLGLRRAFQRAGARTVIMSLFQINDQQTHYFIERLYTERLVNRVQTAEAMQRTSRAILNSRREAGWRTIPVDWGDFIAVGDWR
jgi:CHAT domain-containing protein